MIIKSGIEYTKTESDLENQVVAVDENGKELTGLRLCRWVFNYIIDSKKRIAELQEERLEQNHFITQLQDKLHRRNLQIKDLKNKSVKSNSVATEILVTAIKWLQNQDVDNPFRGYQGIDCDEVSKAIDAVNKVCSL